MSYNSDFDLDSVLNNCEVSDIGILIDHITDKGEGRIALSSGACGQLIAVKRSGIVEEDDLKLISSEIRSFGGNSIFNLFRGGNGVTYKEVLTDVAEHLKVNCNKNSSCERIEIEILLKVLEQSIEKMTEEERKEILEGFGGSYTTMTGPALMLALQTAIKASGFATYKLAAIVAQAVAKAILGRGLAFSTVGPLMKGISTFAGPIGWVITGIWTAFDLASPAYRVTIPCVIQIAYMRQKMLNEKNKDRENAHATEATAFCPSCHTPHKINAKFCQECGHRLGQLSIM